MIRPIDEAAARQNRALQEALSGARAELEAYKRAVVWLSNTITTRAETIRMVDGRVVIPKAEYMAIPGLYTVDIAPAHVTEEGAEEGADPEEMVVVVVEPVEGQNGLSVPQRPRIVRP